MSSERNKEESKTEEQMVVLVMGSGSDLEYAKEVVKTLRELGIQFEARIASAHKLTQEVIDMIGNYNGQENKSIVYIAVAGGSNALGGVIDANTTSPVINAPPYSEKFGGMDILSSFRMPSGVTGATVLEPEAAALAVAKIFALDNPELREKMAEYQKKAREKVLRADRWLRDTGL